MWAHIIGWSIVAATLSCIPAFAIFNIYHAEGPTIQSVKKFEFFYSRKILQIFYSATSTRLNPTFMNASTAMSTIANMRILMKIFIFFQLPCILRQY